MEGTNTEASAWLRDHVGLQDVQDTTTSCVKSFTPRGCSGTQPLLEVLSRAEAGSKGGGSLDSK